MKKSFKKLGFVSLVASSVLLGSMNATDLETYAALQKPSHVFGNYAEKDETTGSGDKHTASSGTPTPSTPPTKETPPATSGGTGGEHHTASSGTPPASSTPPTPTPPTSGGNTITSQLTKDTTMVNGLSKVSVDSMNTTLSGVTQLSQQTAAISNLLSGNPSLGSVISNAQGLSSAFSALESAQNTLKGYLDSSSATIGQLTNGSNAVVGALNKAINQVDMALADLATADAQKTQAVALVAASDSATTTTVPSIS